MYAAGNKIGEGMEGVIQKTTDSDGGELEKGAEAEGRGLSTPYNPKLYTKKFKIQIKFKFFALLDPPKNEFFEFLAPPLEGRRGLLAVEQVRGREALSDGRGLSVGGA